MGWDSIEVQSGKSEIEAIIDFVENDAIKCIAYSHEDDMGVYYLAVQKDNKVYVEVASTKSYRGENADGFIHVKFIHEAETPIYTKPSKSVLEALTDMGDNFNYEWRNLSQLNIDNTTGKIK